MSVKYNTKIRVFITIEWYVCLLQIRYWRVYYNTKKIEYYNTKIWLFITISILKSKLQYNDRNVYYNKKIWEYVTIQRNECLLQHVQYKDMSWVFIVLLSFECLLQYTDMRNITKSISMHITSNSVYHDQE